MQGDDAATQTPRLLDLLRRQIRLLHYSLRTEEAYVHWVRAFIRFHRLRHPSDVAQVEVEAFLIPGWPRIARWRRARTGGPCRPCCSCTGGGAAAVLALDGRDQTSARSLPNCFAEEGI